MKKEKEISQKIEQMIKAEFEEAKLNFACLLNELEFSTNSPDYLRAIQDIKKRTGIAGTILELFRF